MDRRYPQIDILTIDELLHEAEVKMPPQHGTFEMAQRVQAAKQEAEQIELELQ